MGLLLWARAAFQRPYIYPLRGARETALGNTSSPAVPAPDWNPLIWLSPASWSRTLGAKRTPGTVHGKDPTSPSGRVSRSP